MRRDLKALKPLNRNVNLIWLPDYEGMEDNEIVDHLAKRGAMFLSSSDQFLFDQLSTHLLRR